MALTYQCHVLWNSIWAIVLPILSVIATFVTGTGVVYECAILKEGQDMFASTLTGWITAFFSLTLATNICCTSLIALRIWFTTRKIAKFSGQQTLLPVVIIMVELGAIYSICCVILLTVYTLGSNAQYPVIDGMFPVISIVFNMIIVRIAMGVANNGTTVNVTSQNPPSGAIDQGCSHNSHSSQYPMTPLAVTITQIVHKETDSEDPTPVKERDDTASFTDDSQTMTCPSAKEHGSWNAV